MVNPRQLTLASVRDVRFSLRTTRVLVGLLPFVIVGMLIAGTVSLRAQNVTVTAKVDSNNILIGDWLNLHLDLRHPLGTASQFDALPDSLAGFEILRRDSVVKKTVDREIVETTTWTITSYDSGMFVIPPLRARYTASGDTTVRFAETMPIPVFVHGMGVDTSQAIKDIKPPIAPGISFAEILPWLIGIAVIAGVAWLIYYFMKKRKRGESFIPEPPPRPAHELALEELRAIEAEKYWQRGKAKEYHSRLTDVIRVYIERKFALMAPEMITDDILDAPVIRGLDPASIAHLKDILTLADLVKFAKLQPLGDENERSMRGAVGFIELTMHATARKRPEDVPQEAQA